MEHLTCLSKKDYVYSFKSPAIEIIMSRTKLKPKFIWLGYIIAQSITDVHHHEYLYSFTLNNSILMQYNTPQTHLKILKWNYCNYFINDRNLQKWTCYWCGSTHCLWSLQTGWEKQEWKRLQPRPFSKDWSDTLLTALQLHTYWWPNWTDKRKQVSGFVLFFLIWDLLWLAVAAVSHRWYIFKIVTGCVI